MEPRRIQAVEHVHLEARPGLEEELQWFYGEVGRLDFVPHDHPAAPGMRFRSAQLELRIALVEKPKIATVGRRVTLLVPSLEVAAATLDERSVPYERQSGLMFTDRRMGTQDPAGNRVELKQGWPNAPL